MQFYYGSQMPLRVLDECEFWKLQEAEHTVVIRQAVPNLEERYVNDLKQWEVTLNQTHQHVIRFIETAIRYGGAFPPALYHHLMQLVFHCLNQSEQFIQFCHMLIQHSKAISTNMTAVSIMKHIIRESEYFMGIAQTILYHNESGGVANYA